VEKREGTRYWRWNTARWQGRYSSASSPKTGTNRRGGRKFTESVTWVVFDLRSTKGRRIRYCSLGGAGCSLTADAVHVRQRLGPPNGKCDILMSDNRKKILGSRGGGMRRFSKSKGDSSATKPSFHMSLSETYSSTVTKGYAL